MYKNLNPDAFGVSGRQSELIELALTYGFKGLDLDLTWFSRQVEMHGLQHARRFLRSAGIKIGGFELPVRWQGDDALYQQDLDQLPQLAETAAEIGATGCRTEVMPACDERPYHENFEFHRQRFTEIADTLAPHSIRLGLDFQATTSHRTGRRHSFIHSPDALLTLAKTVGVSNVGVVVDVWNWHVSGGHLDQLRQLSADQIVMVRIADAPADVELVAITDDQRLLPGTTGVVDIVSVLAVLLDLGYAGPVTPYPCPSKLPGGTRDSIVRQAANSIEKAWKAATAKPEEVVAAVAAVEGT